MHDDVISVLAKLEQRLSPTERTETAAFCERFAYVPDGGTKAYDDKEDIIDALQTGILSRKIVRYAYKDASGRAKRGFLALFALLLYGHGLYTVGARGTDAAIDTIDWRKTLGVFAVERFTDAEHLRERAFDVPSDFKTDEVLHGAFGIHVGDPDKVTRVVVEFSKASFLIGTRELVQSLDRDACLEESLDVLRRGLKLFATLAKKILKLRFDGCGCCDELVGIGEQSRGTLADAVSKQQPHDFDDLTQGVTRSFIGRGDIGPCADTPRCAAHVSVAPT